MPLKAGGLQIPALPCLPPVCSSCWRSHRGRRLPPSAPQTNPDLIYLCDPVLGDEGKLYVPAELIPIFQEQLTPLAQIITPNQFELEKLTGSPIADEGAAWRAVDKMHAKGIPNVVVSSVDHVGTRLHRTAPLPTLPAASSRPWLSGSCPATLQRQATSTSWGARSLTARQSAFASWWSGWTSASPGLGTCSPL